MRRPPRLRQRDRAGADSPAGGSRPRVRRSWAGFTSAQRNEMKRAPARCWRAGAEDALKFGRKLVEDYAKTAPAETEG